jgi:septal ring-binding cell division protein DamX
LPVAVPGDSAVGSPEDGGQPPKAEANAPAGGSAGKVKPKTPVSKVEAPPAKAAVPVSETTGHEWLNAQPGQNFTLQLVGSRDRSSIDQFIHRYGIAKPYAVFVRDLGGSPWYSLVSGSYPSRGSAIAARAKLPKGVAGVWPRTFASIREQLRGG